MGRERARVRGQGAVRSPLGVSDVAVDDLPPLAGELGSDLNNLASHRILRVHDVLVRGVHGQRHLLGGVGEAKETTAERETRRRREGEGRGVSCQGENTSQRTCRSRTRVSVRIGDRAGESVSLSRHGSRPPLLTLSVSSVPLARGSPRPASWLNTVYLKTMTMEQRFSPHDLDRVLSNPVAVVLRNVTDRKFQAYSTDIPAYPWIKFRWERLPLASEAAEAKCE